MRRLVTAGDPGSRPTAFLVALVFTLASLLGMNPYFYGAGDNTITIPFVLQSIDPRLYPGDFMLAQRRYYYTYAWNGIGWLHAHLGIPLPTLFLTIYCIALYATFLALFLIGLKLFRRPAVAVTALLFLLFSKPSLAGVDTIEKLLNTREMATPFVLFAIYVFLQGRTGWAFFLLGLGYLIHPLTVHYGLAMLTVASIVEMPRRGLRPLLAGWLAFLAVASPLLWWRYTTAPPSMHLFSADPRWLYAMHVRSSHHMFPLSWGWPALTHVVLVLALLGVAWRYRPPSEPDSNRIMAAFIWTILALCACGVVFAEWLPLGAAFVFQPPRSFQFLEYITMLYVANFVYVIFQRAKRFPDILPAMAAGLAMAYDASQSLRAAMVLLAAALLTAIPRIVRRVQLGERGFVLGVTVLVAGAGAICWGLNEAYGISFSASSSQDPQWLDVQRWAREHTGTEDAFILPRDVDDGFRVESERTIYADDEDGGLMNSNPAFGIEWMRRMRLLRFDPQNSDSTHFRLDPAAVVQIAREMGVGRRKVFLVEEPEDGSLGYPIRYRNASYLVAEVTLH